METTASLVEVFEILRSEHRDPHHILGMHEVEVDGKKAVVVRAFIPQAASIEVIDDEKPEQKYDMKKVCSDGFFEAVIPDRPTIFRYRLSIADYLGNQWTTYDPYSFNPYITDFDKYLFGQGTHYKIFEKLGSHPMTIDGVDGVLFAVWAPNAKRVSVIGDFNGWDGRRHPMRCLGYSGIWELFIPGVSEGDIYKYEIKTREDYLLEKSDPYGNYMEVRPNSASIVYDINKYQWNDAQWMEKRQKTDPLNQPVSIYEVHLGSWMRVPEEGNRYLTYREAAHKLVDYVKAMGYTHIELLPITEHPYDGSWGYQVTGYYAPTSRFGTPEDFMYFVDYCHQNNIGVILDWVPAHFPKDSYGLIRFDGTALYEHEDPRQGEHPDWGTLIFNYGRIEVKLFLIANAIFWFEKYHIDGLRVDAVASMLYLDYGKTDGNWIPNKYGGRENLEAVEFFKHLNSIVYQKFPGIMMIAEESTAWPNVSRPTDIGGLGFGLKWNMGWMNDFLRYMKKDPIHRKYHHNDLTFGLLYAFTENFILVLSHDEVVHGKGSMISKMPGDYWQKFANLRVAYGFMYGHPGKKLLFMGGEIAQFNEWSEAKSLDWHLLQFEKHKGMQEYIKDLNHLYLKESAFWEYDFTGEGFEWINASDADVSMVSFVRKGKNPKDTLIFVCNFTPVPHFQHRIGVPAQGNYKEIFNSDHSKYGGSNVLNEQVITADHREWDGRAYSIELRIPPLGMTILKRVEE
ncbi:1,4-alpha-glucan branching protein GlgB [Defluviitalea raffinosedens]|uniref:1,4-alpha-glucan branching protein GlgB n=1 Tax=Defluviitalea raffinosedens TaxID=1450156 RepID=UPI0019592B7F|nr:1,4-alpha-glucan branching protein GlgB [Defluviitalea raffinosedens]MBM7685644.1 1,4-alpha-glucan branching enzyme [Defluviitalea raffinosedens]